MAPWMIVALVIAVGFVVLLIAPTIHRKINHNSRTQAENQRISRAESLRSSEMGATLSFARAADAAAVRDRLLLNGVRAELVQENGETIMIYNSADKPTVKTVRSELGID